MTENVQPEGRRGRGRPATGQIPRRPTRIRDLPWEMLYELYGPGRAEAVRKLVDEFLGLAPADDVLERPCETCLERSRRRAQARLAEQDHRGS